MSKKHHGSPAPIPPGNQPHSGTPAEKTELPSGNETSQPNETFQEHDPRRRLGDFTGTGEHSREEPSELNDGNQHGHSPHGRK